MTELKRQWLMKLIEGMVRHPDGVDFVIRREFFELEIILKVHPKDKYIFTPPVMEAITLLVRQATQVEDIVIYMKGEETDKVMQKVRESFM